MQTSEIIAYILLPILFAVASLGGIGGGIILIPLLIGMFSFTTKESIAIASAIVFLSSLFRFIFMSAHAGHPERQNATQIDYNLVRAAFPAFLVGGYFGVLLSVSLGELILAVLMMVTLVLLSIQVLAKSIKLYKKESAQLAARRDEFVNADHVAEIGGIEEM